MVGYNIYPLNGHHAMYEIGKVWLLGLRYIYEHKCDTIILECYFLNHMPLCFILKEILYNQKNNNK